jgi:hypothetical protein
MDSIHGTMREVVGYKDRIEVRSRQFIPRIESSACYANRVIEENRCPPSSPQKNHHGAYKKRKAILLLRGEDMDYCG